MCSCTSFIAGESSKELASSPNLPDYELSALHDFYNATNGDHWVYDIDDDDPGAQWVFNSDANPCEDEWQGVTCILPSPYDFYHVYSLILNSFEMVGTLTPSLTNLTQLTTLMLSDNHLSGTFPDSYGNMLNLQEVILRDNHLDGTLPSSLLWSANITDIIFNANFLEGTLPMPPAGYVAGTSKLETLELEFNRFTGPVDEVIPLLTSLQILSLSVNAFSGPLPEPLPPQFATAKLGDNLFTGAIPTAYIWSTHLTGLEITVTNVQGSVPAAPINWDPSTAAMKYLILFTNLLSGALPSTLVQLPQLVIFDVSANLLTGTLPPALPNAVKIFIAASNRLTGTVPFSALVTDNMATISIGLNCFHGTLPNDLCSIQSLQALNMECLSCGSTCRTRWFKNSGFIQHHPVTGTLPACLFELPALTAAAFDYNALSGTIPASLASSTVLQRMSLTNNYLTGSIPHLSNHILEGVTFSYNKLSGRLHYNSSAQPNHWTIETDYNRLSGSLSHTFANAADTQDSNVQVLAGNLFSCNTDRSNIPSSDRDASTFQCGSNNYNGPYYGWLSATAVTLAVLLAGYYSRESTSKVVDAKLAFYLLTQWSQTVWGENPDCELTTVSYVAALSRRLVASGVCCAVVAVVVLAPSYAILTAFYGTYTYQYAWTLSSVLLSGVAPFVIQLLLFLLVLCTALIFARNDLLVPATTSFNISNCSGYWTWLSWRKLKVLVVCVLYVCINIAVVGTANVAYIATTLYADPVYQVYISIFKLFWNILFYPYLSRWMVYQLSATRADFFALELGVSLMNNVGLPLFAVLSVSPQCFFNMYCGTIERYDVLAYCAGPFYYGYQCSYVYMNYYAAAFIYVSILTTFGIPLVELLAQQVHRHAPPGTTWFRIMDVILPRILRPIQSDPLLIPARNMFRPYFDATQFLVSQLTFLALILTLGVVSPPLAVALAVTMVATAAFTLLKVGRFITNAVEAKQMLYVQLIEQESRGIATPEVLRRSTWILLYFSCCFMTLFLFDTLGDAVGFDRAYWVLIVVPVLTPLVHASVCAYMYISDTKSAPVPRTAHRYSTDESQDIELSQSVEQGSAACVSQEAVVSPIIGRV